MTLTANPSQEPIIQGGPVNDLVGLFCPNDTPLERVRALSPPGITVEWVDSNGRLKEQVEVMKEAVRRL